MFFIWAHNQPQWSSLEHRLHLPRLAGHSLGLFPYLSNGRLDSCSSSTAGLGGTHPQNSGDLLFPYPTGGGRSCQSGSRRSGARSPQGQRVAACGLSGGGSVCLCVCMSVSVCICVVCTGLLYVPACIPVCTHPLAYTGPCACVCRVLRSGTCETEIAEEANMLLAGGRTAPRNLTWGPRASSDGGGGGVGGGGAHFPVSTGAPVRHGSVCLLPIASYCLHGAWRQRPHSSRSTPPRDPAGSQPQLLTFACAVVPWPGRSSVPGTRLGPAPP